MARAGWPETGTPVRIVTIGAEPWFVAVDVCAVLDRSNPTMAVATLDDDERVSALLRPLAVPSRWSPSPSRGCTR